MDAIDILGGLLGGGKSGGGGGGLGGKILEELLKGAQRSTQSKPSPRSGAGSAQRPTDISRGARELEDLLGVARDRQGGGARSQPPRQETPRYNNPPSFEQAGSRYQPGGSRQRQRERTEPMSQDDEVLVLVRAMINAAKADGRVTQDEQKSIIDRISNPTQEAVNFLRAEFGKQVDVREFAWSVPLGMEQQVYTLSLATIDLDSNPEAQYLRDLAHGLRLAPDLCNQIHQQYGGTGDLLATSRSLKLRSWPNRKREA